MSVYPPSAVFEHVMASNSSVGDALEDLLSDFALSALHFWSSLFTEPFRSVAVPFTVITCWLFSIIIGYFFLKRLILERYEGIVGETQCRLWLNLEGRFVFVTGCDSGFGRLLVGELLKRSVHVFAGCYTQRGVEEWEKQKGSTIGNVFPLRLDITSDSSVKNAYDSVRKILSEKNATLWAVVNNAGVFSIFGPADWCSTKEFRDSFEVNTLGAIRVSQQFAALLKHSRGRIVTMGSSAGRLHGQFVAPYVTAKFAVEAYMDCLRLEMRHFGVSVHILEPGAFKTDLLCEQAQNERVEKIWRQLPTETRFEYGETFKENFKEAWTTGVNLVANPNLSWVVGHYLHAIGSRFPRLRYYSGYDAIFAFIPLSLCPSYVQDVVLSGMYALQPGPPLVPECLRAKKSKDD